MGLHRELRDYRELEGRLPQFDKIASVGMFEHVGLKICRSTSGSLSGC